jgi:hypothetical protein
MISNFGRFSNDPTSQSDVGYSEPTMSSVAHVGDVVSHDGNPSYRPSAERYSYKSPILYGFGGVWFPPLVLFLMGGSRKKCAIMLCIWPISFLLIFLFFIGVIPILGMYIWSVVACYQEAERQNKAHGL